MTKKIHNTLQGVNGSTQRVHKEETRQVFDWILENARRYWFPAGGPLSSPEEGGADIIFVSRPSYALLYEPWTLVMRGVSMPRSDTALV